MKELKKLIDVKSIVTLLFAFTLAFIVIFMLIKTDGVDENVFLLFSNVITAVVTYFFTKKKSDNTENRDN